MPVVVTSLAAGSRSSGGSRRSRCRSTAGPPTDAAPGLAIGSAPPWATLRITPPSSITNAMSLASETKVLRQLRGPGRERRQVGRLRPIDGGTLGRVLMGSHRMSFVRWGNRSERRWASWRRILCLAGLTSSVSVNPNSTSACDGKRQHHEPVLQDRQARAVCRRKSEGGGFERPAPLRRRPLAKAAPRANWTASTETGNKAGSSARAENRFAGRLQMLAGKKSSLRLRTPRKTLSLALCRMTQKIAKATRPSRVAAAPGSRRRPPRRGRAGRVRGAAGSGSRSAARRQPEEPGGHGVPPRPGHIAQQERHLLPGPHPQGAAEREVGAGDAGVVARGGQADQGDPEQHGRDRAWSRGGSSVAGR